MEFAESTRGKYISLTVVYLIALALMLYGMLDGLGYKYGYYSIDAVVYGLYLPLSGVFALKLIFDFLYCRTDNGVFKLFSVILGVLHFYSIQALAFGITAKSPLWVVFIGCMISAFAGGLAHLTEFAVQGIIFTLNIGYCGKKPMSIWRKIAEVFLQIALLPISIIIQILATPYAIMCMHFIGRGIVKYLFYKAMKKQTWEEGELYYVPESDKVVSKNVTHEIKDADGVVIGTYDTTEQHIEHDNGLRYDYSESDVELSNMALIHTFFSLPLRIVSLIFSIAAVFIPNMYVSAIKPNTEYDYNYKVFMYTDILIFYNGYKNDSEFDKYNDDSKNEKSID